ncbi:MAG: tRNA uracil 4-sulfurtransferase ThiI [Saccharofermentanales bacterium]
MEYENTVYKKIILARIGEIALKGLNKNKFEEKLINNLKRRLNKIGRFEVTQNQSRIYVAKDDSANLPAGDSDESAEMSAAMNITVKVFGVVSASYAWRFDGDLNIINKMAKAYVQEIIDKKPISTFKIEARRADKRFPYSSPEICEEVGAHILQEFPLLKVQVKNPELVLNVEIREHVYIHSGRVMGFRGLPVGTAGKGLLLLSGGIDSPVAGFMMASRGMEIEAVYFHSFPYTSDRAKEKVIELARLLSEFTGRLRLHIVDFTSIQLELRDKSPNEMITVTMRRVMMRIAEKIAKDIGAAALITGESLGQVASQTLEAINCTDSVVSLPVFRPLIGTDKDDTILIARKIGTFETSILPYEDCCTVFVAKHPKTHPSLETAEKCEKNLDIEELVRRGVSQVEILIL